MQKETAPKKSPINVWKPTKTSEIYVEQDNKIFICRFERIWNQPKFRGYEKFSLKKGCYENKLDIITKYINYFLNFYDTDLELVNAYLKIKFALEKDGMYPSRESIPSYIDFIYELIFTPTMVQKIKKLVDDNYLDDVEGDPSGKKKVYKSNKKHLESLEFTNQHVKILLAISFGIKIMSPVVLHFLYLRNIKIEKDSDMIYQFYKRLFPLLQEDCDIYVKLYLYVKAKILESNVNNQKMYDHREIFGEDVFTLINNFVKRVFISENLVKYEFGGNILGFNRTVVNFQIKVYLKLQYEKNIAEVTGEKNAEGLSSADKMGMNLSKIDEGLVVLSEVNVESTIEFLKKIFDLSVSEEELDFYIKNHHPSEIQIYLVRLYYAKYFGSYRDLNLLSRRQYLTLLILLKKKLILDLGFDDNGEMHATALPYVLTGNMVDKLNNRIIRNLQFKHSMDNCYIFDRLRNEKFKYIHDIMEDRERRGITSKSDIESSIVSSLINTKFTYCEYSHPELMGEEIQFSDSKITYEIGHFLSM